jgi:hypothetical protein
MPVTVEVYPSGVTQVFDGGTIPTSSRIAFAATPDHRELAMGAGTVSAKPDTGWPPSWFGSIRSARTDTSARTEEILRAEFGRDDHR